MRRLGAVLLAGSLVLAGTAARANDSAAAIGLGGLALERNAAIAMDAEDLFISREEVRVRYRFTNRGPRDVTLLVSFPVPVLPEGLGGYLGDTAIPDYRRLNFRTTIDGRPVRLDFAERGVIAGRDVTARVAARGWPLRWFGDYGETPAFLARLSAADKAAALREGLLKRDPDDPAGLVPAWSVVTHVTRRQTFPAGRTVEVAHSYRPYAGGSVSGSLDRGARSDEYWPQKQRRHCIEPDFLAAYDRRTQGPNRQIAAEVWLDYILSSGANWRGPIGDFRLVVDKGKPENLVSFCMDGVRRISPTQFEVRKRNFEPRRDLNVLIVEFYKPE